MALEFTAGDYAFHGRLPVNRDEGPQNSLGIAE
jgi:hypothetical protein